MTTNDYVLLRTFRDLFEGKLYNHRNSSLGDKVASSIFEDLFVLDKSPKLTARITSHERVVNARNLVVGRSGRRGDGTLGERVPRSDVVVEPGFLVARGQIATIEIGAESKILAKAMIKQIDRVMGDLIRQKEDFERRSPGVIPVAMVGVNFADHYSSVEGDRLFSTDGKKNKHPIQEADEAIRRLESFVHSHFFEMVLLKFKATNESPFPFAWLDAQRQILEYSAALTRISREYEKRFI